MILNNLKTNAKLNNDNDWYTPLNIYENILNLFNLNKFDYDPATTKELAKNANIKFYDDIETNGLKQDWRSYKNIWINPPFTLKKDFIEKAYLEILDNKSHIENIFILIPIETLTNLNTYNLLSKNNNMLFRNIIISKGRIKFVKRSNDRIYTQKTSPFFSTVIIHLSRTFDYKLLWYDLNKE